MKRSLAYATSLLLVQLAGSAAATADETSAWRVFVADRDAPKVTVVDTQAGTIMETFGVTAPAALHRSSSGRTVFAVQGEAGVVSAFSSGITFEDHGDHGDIEVSAPKLLDFQLEGKKPAHFVEVQGNVAQWFDGEDTVRLFSEKAVLEGESKPDRIGIEAAHHGVAVPFAGHVVVSIPNPEDATKRPVGARILNLSGERVGEDVSCPGLHGSADSGSIHALACNTGLLLIEHGADAPVIRHLPYAKSLPEGSSSTLIGGKGLQYFIGNYGADRIVLIDPAGGEEGFRLVQLPTRRVHFAVDPIRPKFAYVFTEDGQLHRVDVIGGKIDASIALTEPYSMDGHWNDPRPRIAVAGDQIVVTDPLAGKLHLIDAASFAEAGAIDVASKPYNIVAVGGSGQSHHHE